MLQRNNNNNRACLEMSGSTREVLQKCQKTYLPFSSRLELADMPLVRGLRAWAVCSKDRRRSAPSPGAPGSCRRSADVYPVGQWGRLGRDLGLPLDSTYSSKPRQTSIGALVTVATLKASERGGQTQTHCLFLGAESGRCLYSTDGPRSRGQPLGPQTPSTLVGSWLRGKVGGFRDLSVAGKIGAPDMAETLCQVKSRSTRRWRTSCKAAVPVQGKVLTERREDPGVHALGGGQEGRDKEEFPTHVAEKLCGKQDGGNARGLGCCHSQTRICSECHRQKAEQGISRQKGPVSGREEDQLDGIREKETAAEGTSVSRLKPFILPRDEENHSGGVNDREQPESPRVQEELHPVSSHDEDPLLDTTGDGDIHTRGEDASSGHPRHVDIADVSVGSVNGFVEHIKSAERESVRLAGDGGTAEGGVQFLGRHSCSEGAQTRQPPSPAGGSTSSAADGTGHGQINLDIKSVSQFNKEVELCGKCLPKEKDPAAINDEVLLAAERRVHEEERDGEKEIQLTAPEIKKLCGEHGDKEPEVRSTDGVNRLAQEDRRGEFTSERAEGESHWATGRRESEETRWTEERSFSDSAAPTSEKAVGEGWIGLETGQFNSPSRGPATSVAHLPTNPAPPGVMATGFLALEGGQINAGSGAPAPTTPSLGVPNRNGGLDESTASVGVAFPDEDLEGDDGFGLFVQAEDQSSWDDGFVASLVVPSVKSASAGVTNSSFGQSEGAWTAFRKDLEVEAQDTRREWWPTNAVEETRSGCTDKKHVNGVFVEAFSSLSPPCCEREAVPTLDQLLRSVLDRASSAKDHGLLDGFHDLDKMIGLKYKRANAVSRDRLLHSLHLGQSNTEYMTGNQAANHSPSLVSPFISPQTQNCGKRRLSTDLNKNVTE